MIVATWEPNEVKVLSTIRDLGLELDVIFNKGAVMILPAGVNKATGLMAALKMLQLSPHNVVGVGDAENDHAFLQICECSVAVANALPSIRERVDFVTSADRGAGVVELIGKLEADDLDSIRPRLSRHQIRLGTDSSGRAVGVDHYGPNIMIAGPSGTGKTTLATDILEQLVERAYQFCLLDPEGDYEGLEGPIEIGGPGRRPDPAEVAKALQQPGRSVSVNLLGVPLEERPLFLGALIPLLHELWERFGRPHQLVLDESHHLVPKDLDISGWKSVQGAIFITVEPDSIALARSATVCGCFLVATGGTADQHDRTVCARAIGMASSRSIRPGDNEVLVWDVRNSSVPVAIQPQRGMKLSPRHSRKYMEAELPEDRSFYFRGPDQKLNLRAQNLKLFIQTAAGVDDATWLHHLHLKDYSRWVREALKDESLADEIAGVEESYRDSAAESRTQISSAIERRYTKSS